MRPAAGRCTAAGARPESRAAGRGLPAPVFEGGSAGSGSDRPEEEKGKLLGLRVGGGRWEGLRDWVQGTRDCRVERPVSRSSAQGRLWRGSPHPTLPAGSTRLGRELEQASRPGAAPARGGRRGGLGRSAVRWARGGCAGRALVVSVLWEPRSAQPS